MGVVRDRAPWLMPPTTPTKRKGAVAEQTTPVKSPKKPLAPKLADDAVAAPPIRPAKSLAVGALIEALDEEDLWYPARVVAVEGKRVRISFDGWDAQWDEWFPRTSERMCEHRGWGGPSMADDWQADSMIEALDMEGKWYKAKVLHVAETRCRVHYNGWPTKWDEWIKKDAGRCVCCCSARQTRSLAAQPPLARWTHWTAH